jgi:hypothetical protein
VPSALSDGLPATTSLLCHAEVARTKPRFGVKQVDRFLSISAIDIARLTPSWAKFVIGARRELVVALDWTDFEKDDHTWKTVKKSTLAGRRNDYEYEVIERLHDAIPREVAVTLLADRAFGDQKLYALLSSLGWDYVIRFRRVIVVEDSAGAKKPAEDWVPKTGRATMIRDARVTNDRALVPAVVVVHQAKMREPWCLATSLADRKAADVSPCTENASRSKRRSEMRKISGSAWASAQRTSAMRAAATAYCSSRRSLTRC